MLPSALEPRGRENGRVLTRNEVEREEPFQSGEKDYRGSMKSLIAEAQALLPVVIAMRRALHRMPEIGLELPETQRAVLDALRELPIQITRGDKLTSVVGVLDGARSGPTVLLRADMDALAMQETADVPFRSERPNAAHTCGHDAHTTMLVGAARLLARHHERLSGRILFMFQPGEEGHDGARCAG